MHNSKKDVSFYDLFLPLTNRKICFFLIVVGSIVFFNALFGGFVWDDRTFIQFNPDMKHVDLWYLAGPNMFNNINAGQYRFFVALYFTVMHTIFGDHTFFYHLFQITIHIINAVFVYFLFARFFPKYISFFLALLFLVHPIQVESVSYIASSGNTFFVFFGLTGLILAQKKPTWFVVTFTSLLLLLSMLSKETGILFVLLVISYRILFHREQIFRYIASGVAAVLMYCVMRFFIAGVYFSKVTLAPISRLDLSERLINTPAVILYYLKTFFFPYFLAIEQYWIIENVDIPHFYLPLFIDIIGLISLLGMGTYLYFFRKNIFPLFLFFVTWLITGLLMYSQIFALNMTVADRWFYFPIIGLLGILGILMQWGLPHLKYKHVVVLGMVVIISILSVRTIIRNTNWQDPITLYLHDSAVEDNYDLQNSLGGEYNARGETQKALAHFKKSVSMFAHETNLFNTGLIYEQLGDKKTAESYYLQAYRSKGYGEVPKPHRHHSITYFRLTLLLLEHSPQKAYDVIVNGIKDYPYDPQLWYVKVLVEEKLGNIKAARISAQKAYMLFPSPNTKQLLKQVQTATAGEADETN